MRHKNKRYQLNRFTSWHKATLKGLVRSILTYEHITTTLNKAKAVRPLMEKLITLAKNNNLAHKRRAFKILGDHNLVKLLFEDIAPRFSAKTSGFLRIIKLGFRRGDNAAMAILELTELKSKPKKTKKEKKKDETVKEEKTSAASQEKPSTEKETKKEAKPEIRVKEKTRETKQPKKKFFWGIKNVFKKERNT
ncbi:MAG: 50S ribosomal protein L17, partial [Candidatus Omnitrophica bacterium]|nr:50S ribosomal protein L17 [Candidatus Omnitrophota bacterium]